MNEPNENTTAMGLRIQQARKAANFTQMQFAEKIGVSTQYISDLERGVVGCSTTTLVKICDTLAVSADYSLLNMYKKFLNLSPQAKELAEESFKLLDKALSLK